MPSDAEVRVEWHRDANGWEILPGVMSAQFERGRRGVRERDNPGVATIRIFDPARDYDPLNDSSPQTFRAGKGVRISVKPPGGAFTVRWQGVVRKWVPSSWSGDSGPLTVTLHAIGLHSLLNSFTLELEGWADTAINQAMCGADPAVFSFDLVNEAAEPAGTLWADNPGVAAATMFTDEQGDVKGHTSTVAGSIDFVTELEAVVFDDWPANHDVVLDGGAMLAVFTLEGHTVTPPTGAGETWVLFGQGDTIFGWVVFMQEDRVGNVTADTNPIKIRTWVYIDGVRETDWTLDVGTRGDWIGHRRAVQARVGRRNPASTFGVVSATAAAPVNADGDFGTFTLDFRRDEAVIVQPQPTNPADPGPVKFGTYWNGSATNRFVGNLELVAMSTGLFAGVGPLATKADNIGARDMIETFARDIAGNGLNLGLPERTSDAFFAQICEAVPLSDAVATFGSSVTSGISHAPSWVVSGRSGIDVVNDLIDLEHGRLFQPLGGEFHLFDAAALKARAAVSQATYTDDPAAGSALSPTAIGVGSRFEDGVEHAIVTNFRGSYRTAYGGAAHALDITRAYTLPTALDDVTQDHADAMVDKFSDETPTFQTLRIQPDRNPALWWPELAARDIGHRVTVRNQPGGVGLVTTSDVVIEGERWTFSADTGLFDVLFWVSDHALYTGITYPT